MTIKFAAMGYSKLCRAASRTTTTANPVEIYLGTGLVHSIVAASTDESGFIFSSPPPFLFSEGEGIKELDVHIPEAIQLCMSDVFQT